jgi:hypothetical protein
MQVKVPPLLQLKADKFREKLYHTYKNETPRHFDETIVGLGYVN